MKDSKLNTYSCVWLSDVSAYQCYVVKPGGSVFLTDHEGQDWIWMQEKLKWQRSYVSERFVQLVDMPNKCGFPKTAAGYNEFVWDPQNRKWVEI